MTRRRRTRRGGALEWTAHALGDLIQIDEFIAADNPVAAQRWVAKLVATAEAAARSPHSGRVVPERASQNVREVFLRTYRILYRVRESDILVLAVLEGHRQLPPDVRGDE